MQYRRLGRSGLQVSALSLGSWVTYHNQVDTNAARELLAAAMVWGYAVHVTGAGLTGATMSSIVSLSGGALFANIVSVIILIAETIMQRR